jgi:hypothetical protein
MYVCLSDEQRKKNLLHFSFYFSYVIIFFFIYIYILLLLLLFNDIFSSASVLPDLAGKLTGTGFFFLPIKWETIHVRRKYI